MLDAAVLAASSSRGDCAAGSRGSVQPPHPGTALGGLLQGMFLSLGFKPWETAADLVDLYLLLGCTFRGCSDLL